VTIPPPVTVAPDSTHTPTTTESSDDTSSAVNNTIEPPITENTVETIPSMPAVLVPETTDLPSSSL